MSEAPRQFAAQLRYAIQRAKAVEGKNIGIIQDELGYAIGRQGRTAIEYYLKEHIPPQLADVETLGRELVRRAQLDEQWLASFLSYAGHPAPDKLVAQLFPPTAPASSSTLATTHPLAPTARATHQPLLPMGQLPPPGPLPTSSVMPLSRNPHFVGREQDLLELARALNSGQTAAVSQVGTAAATGLGGIGKTQLASEFVHRYGQFFPGGVFWLSFENPQAVSSEIAFCGGPGAMELRPDFTSRALDEQVRLVQAAWQETTPRLLVFDNCELPTLVTRWRPTTGGCRVLITSRRGDWDPYFNVNVLALDVLPRMQSVELLHRLAPHAEQEVSDAIAAEVGDLPLALHLAGSYLHRYRRAITPAQYLAQLRDPRLLQHPSMQGGGFSPTGHIEHVGRTFAISYDRLQREDSRDALARRLLIHMACFAPGEPVWYDVLVRTLGLDPEQPNDALRAEDAFARLIELGLIQVEGEKGMRIHRLIATFVREMVPEEAILGQRTIEEMIYANLKRTNYEGAPLALLPGEVHMAHVIEETAQHDAAWGATLSAELGWHLWLNGDYMGARTYFEDALETRRRVLGEEDAETARSYSNLGALLCDLDDFQNSQTMLETALALRLRLLGEVHVDTAETLNNLGILHLTQQHNTLASDYLQRALTLYESILGADHLTVAEVANNLGICFLRGLGDPRHAQPHLEHALAVRRQQLGEVHPYTALVYHNLGVVLFELGKYEQAGSNFEQAAAIRRQALGNAHQDTALSQCLFGAVQVYTGAVDAGMVQIEAALTTCRERVGEHHLITAYCTIQWGRCLHKLGEFGKAQSALSKALEIRKSIYQDENPAIGETLDYLGRVYLDQGDLASAADSFGEAYAIHQRILGDIHPQTAASRFHLGLLLAAKGQIAQAVEWMVPAASIFEKQLGAEHPRTQEANSYIRHLTE